MKKILIVILIGLAGMANADVWTQLNNGPRHINIGCSFTIGNKGYIGGGRDTLVNLTKSFWEYDPSIDAWTQKADIPGVSRLCPAGFSIGNMGYVGLGNDSTSFTLLNDFWQYDNVSNTWLQKANFPGQYPWQTTSFS